MKAFAVFVVLIFSGCAMKAAPTKPPALYKAPSHVSKEDSLECEARARESTQDPNQKLAEAWDENLLVQSSINATIGFLTGFWRLPHRPSYRVANAGAEAYEGMMRSCLRAKGYTL